MTLLARLNGLFKQLNFNSVLTPLFIVIKFFLNINDNIICVCMLIEQKINNSMALHTLFRNNTEN